MDKFYEPSEDAINSFKEILRKKSLPVDIKMKFIGYTKQKSMIQISKLSDKYKFLLGADILVSLNEDLYDKFDDLSIEILFSQEIDKISMNMETGKVTLNKPDLVTFSGIVSKYGAEEVLRANQVEDLTVEQVNDQAKDGFIA